MENKQIINHYENVIEELKYFKNKITSSGKIDLTGDNLYFGITFVSKIYGLISIFTDDFIKEHNLMPVIDWINKKNVMMQASHYSDKSLFYEFFNVIYPQLEYRLGQIKYKESLTPEEKEKLVITAEYHVYLYNCLKYYLEQQTTDEIAQKIKEILSIINLYKIVNDRNIVALGSKIIYMDTLNNEVMEGRIVIDSNADLSCHKLSLSEYKGLFRSKKNDVVCLDYSTSFIIRILDIDNTLEC